MLSAALLKSQLSIRWTALIVAVDIFLRQDYYSLLMQDLRMSEGSLIRRDRPDRRNSSER
jgi:hypothetical protein